MGHLPEPNRADARATSVRGRGSRRASSKRRPCPPKPPSKGGKAGRRGEGVGSVTVQLHLDALRHDQHGADVVVWISFPEAAAVGE